MNKEYDYQHEGRYFAQFAPGLEAPGMDELTELGASGCRATYGGAHFIADQATLYRINYCSRLASRILAPLIAFDCHSDRYLYLTALKMPWTELFSTEQTFAIQSSVSNSRISHSQFAGQRLKDAIVDAFREKTGKRPSVDPKNPDVWIHLRIHENRADICLDTSGRALHKRGYRVESVEAPLQETLAAAMVRLSGWEGNQPLFDPMCGSGTLLAEAMMSYCRIPAGYLNPAEGFRLLPEFDGSLWKKVKAECDRQIRPLPEGLISGSDVSNDAIRAAKANLARLPGGKAVRLATQDYRRIEKLENTVLICNPPYGIRLEKNTDMPLFFKAFGDFLKQHCTGSTAYVFFGQRELLKSIGLRTSGKWPLFNGGLEGRLARFDLY
ncbi:MAG: THUMP domain-containing protein [Kiritimatiellae bacterium]|nr:THUMP domain-containing protein [Kiritimatiellia bacterium]